MDLLGDIVEKDTLNEVGEGNFNVAKNGFPELYKPSKISSWKQRLKAKKQQQQQQTNPDPPKETVKEEKKQRSEAESIHAENMDVLNNMTQEQIMNERRELLEQLNPKLIQNLLKNINKRAKSEDGSPLFAEIEGASGTWVGGYNKDNLPHLDEEQVNAALGITNRETLEFEEEHDFKDAKTVRFQEPGEEEEEENEEEEILDEDDIAPLDYQMAQSVDHTANEDLLKDVHFVRNHKHDDEEDIELEKLDINDPNFNEKLHEKYFPDLPKDIEKLKWMQQVQTNDPNKDIVIDSVNEIRFDFNGNLVPPNRAIESTTHSGLHHHSNNPELAGYTLEELAKLSMSTFAPQRSIAVQTLGRILYKLGKKSYYQLVPEVDEETYEQEGTKTIMNNIYSMLWDLVKDLNVIESLELAADESKTRNISVRTYAIDALWLWRKGGGDFRKNKKQDI
ncbi:hypothetical protein KAFR_0H03710 [Kazachstania africana CBS 2517]|uniref:RNA polymerase II-associated protein RBA50 n=1 Tax=Kazachstania africana (strain ATCC 22294 / BCRC 22015 / CBS 2517 / CECT 1963 / NBRC 1671 / NRRL Y-8276) TaxID=1071382 RepID=H2AYK4_KAZAF|nr:hypothetical protein KAFR_0H03710 [Kazachstania africana CBS 2517]CCF59781.1 hypothetical protein KAFR_0H03710 [Kazachstania africana CBS 2517]